MDGNQENMQTLTLFGIYKQAYNIISSHKKIFNKIIISLILPLSLLLLVDIRISNTLLTRIIHRQSQLEADALPNTPRYKKFFNQLEAETLLNSPRYKKISNLISSEWTYFWLFKAGYCTLLLLFSSLSTAAVVYTTTCAYNRKQVTFKIVKNFISKVFKKTLITFLCSYVSLFLYIKISILFIERVKFLPHYLCFRALGCEIVAISYSSYYRAFHDPMVYVNSGFPIWNYQTQTWTKFLNHIDFVGFLRTLIAIGLFYMSIIWQMASVVSVLEQESWIKAMIKSKILIKGKLWINTSIFLTMSFSVIIVRGEYEKLFVHGSLVDLVYDVPFGIFCFLFLCQLILFGFTVQTVTYFVCKSYHHENIDLSIVLEDNLEVHPHDN